MKRILILFFVLFLSGNCFAAAIAQWKCNDNASNATVADAVGSYTGTFHGTGGADDYTSAHTVTGHIGTALGFDNTNDYITVSDNAVFSPIGTPFSITAWIELTAVDSAVDFEIINKMGASDLEWQFQISSDALYFNLYDNSTGGRIGRADTADYSLYEVSGSYLFVVATYDGGSIASGIKLYLDGQQVDDSDNNNGTFNEVEDKSADLHLGKDYGANRVEGNIDNVVIYNTELTPTQVNGLYNEGVGTEEVGLDSYAASNPRIRYSEGYRHQYRSRYEFE